MCIQFLMSPKIYGHSNILKRLGIQLKNDLYTEYEFECLRVDVAEYYENEEKLPMGGNKRGL